MRIGAIAAATVLVDSLDAPATARVSRERALALGIAGLAGAACMCQGWWTRVQRPADRAPPARAWTTVLETPTGEPAGAVLSCAEPQRTLGWYRGLGFSGTSRTLSDGGIELELAGGQRLFLRAQPVPFAVSDQPLLLGFVRLDRAGRRVALPSRILAGPEGELIELL
ncbi:MAG: hypothetical protein IT479_01210 [Xanthomonadales bacterium]|nr:hypothetical protein [Xanthomonadales bacterium]MCC6591867.1 hypothetical protein [Xanthomonadales bacterium]MCE7931879.1 hypothetical protein [Xanthomonadales bacterium PRO6]